MTIGIDVIIAATTVAMTTMTGATTTEAVDVMIAMMIVTMTDETTGVMIDVARTTTVPTTTTARSGLHRHHHPKGEPQWRIQKANREINFIVEGRQATRSNRQTRSNTRRSGTSTLKTHDLCRGLNSQSLSLGKTIGFTSPTPEPIR
jgi:hypothetical protein